MDEFDVDAALRRGARAHPGTRPARVIVAVLVHRIVERRGWPRASPYADR